MEINPFRPRRLRIVEPGWAGFSGYLGTVEFVDGVSVDVVGFVEQQRLGSLVRIEDADHPDVQIGPAVELVRNRTLTTEDPLVSGADRGVEVGGETRLASAFYSREELETIADAKGIDGLRAIGASYGVKGRSILQLINEILERQGAPETGKAD